MKNILERIRQQVLDQKYVITDHALEEAADDDFDIEKALLNGKIERRYTNDPRGTRYKIVGVACDYERQVAIIGRFRGDQVFRIITVYDTEKRNYI